VPSANRQADQAYAETAAALIESYVQSDLFSGSVMVASEGRPLLRKSFGLANREWNIPNAPETKFRIGSVTKNSSRRPRSFSLLRHLSAGDA
jgi:D-alanyl-D-alanine carboxypeptidase